MKKIVYLNGKYINFKFAKISIEDRGFQFSDGVYEVIALKNYKFILELLQCLTELENTHTKINQF